MLWVEIALWLYTSFSGPSSVLDDSACLVWENGFVSLEEKESILDRAC